MVVGIELRGRFSDIYAKLQSEAWKKKGITVAEWIKKERIKRIEEVEMQQFGEEIHGINRNVVTQMIDTQEEITRVFWDLTSKNVDERTQYELGKKFDSLDEKLKLLSLSVTIGKTKHSAEYNSTLTYDIVTRYDTLPRDKIFEVIRIVSEEDYV